MVDARGLKKVKCSQIHSSNLYLREAHFTSSALGDQLGLLSGLSGLSLFFEKIYTEQRQGDHAFTAWCFDRNIQILRVFPVFGPVSSAIYTSYLRIEGSRKGSSFDIGRFAPLLCRVLSSYSFR